MLDRDKITISKSIEFEKGGEIIELSLNITNISPNKIAITFDFIRALANEIITDLTF